MHRCTAGQRGLWVNVTAFLWRLVPWKEAVLFPHSPSVFPPSSHTSLPLFRQIPISRAQLFWAFFSPCTGLRGARGGRFSSCCDFYQWRGACRLPAWTTAGGRGWVVLKAHFGKLMVPSLGRRLAAIQWRSTDRTTVVSLSTG